MVPLPNRNVRTRQSEIGNPKNIKISQILPVGAKSPELGFYAKSSAPLRQKSPPLPLVTVRDRSEQNLVACKVEKARKILLSYCGPFHVNGSLQTGFSLYSGCRESADGRVWDTMPARQSCFCRSICRIQKFRTCERKQTLGPLRRSSRMKKLP